MVDQISTPGSNADSSINISKPSAPKDKKCPFCQQPFTSSSLGRHLDLYIKNKNPKPADGVHNVDEIKKLRGGITRRQPRSSLAKREGSTPVSSGNGDRSGRRSSPSDSEIRDGHAQELKSPDIRREAVDLNTDRRRASVHGVWHGASWEATGVINDIPSLLPNGHSKKWDQEANEARIDRRAADGRKTVTRQMLAKTAFDHKKKLLDALDAARASELALREILGSIRAANRRVKVSATPFNYDPLSLDFPALTLHCLSPPPTLNQITPIASPTSWSIAPPDTQQLEALRNHFREAFHTWRVSLVVSSSANPDELLTYTPDPPRSSTEEAEMQTQARKLEEKVAGHLNATFAHWSTLPAQVKSEVWRLQLAKAVGYKDHTISALKSDREKILQENAHLRAQVEQLSRCQQPREFQMMPPTTIPISSGVAIELNEMGLRGDGIGLSINDKDETVDGLVKTAVARWLAVVQTSRANSGMAAQRSLEYGESIQPALPSSTHHVHSQEDNRDMNMQDLDPDADADADPDVDADADRDENFDVSPSITMPGQSRAPDIPMNRMSGVYSSHNGTNGNPSREREGISDNYSGGKIRL